MQAYEVNTVATISLVVDMVNVFLRTSYGCSYCLDADVSGNMAHAFKCGYRISSIKRPGVYLLPEFADPALIQDRRLYGTGVNKHNDVIRAVYIVGTGRHK